MEYSLTNTNGSMGSMVETMVDLNIAMPNCTDDTYPGALLNLKLAQNVINNILQRLFDKYGADSHEYKEALRNMYKYQANHLSYKYLYNKRRLSILNKHLESIPVDFEYVNVGTEMEPIIKKVIRDSSAMTEAIKIANLNNNIETIEDKVDHATMESAAIAYFGEDKVTKKPLLASLLKRKHQDKHQDKL